MTFKSKAEERRAEWLTRQYAADRASGFTYEGHGIPAPDARLAAARDAVVKAAMAWADCANDLESAETAVNDLLAACAALAGLEGK